jgi:sigma-B regulation protein RsbU (phosphoserine phosphatase)
LSDLLSRVDEALTQIENGTFGLCQTCHEPIEADRLAVDPLVRNCLDHLTRAEQESLERDLDMAYQVQRNMLPPTPLLLSGWSLAYVYKPAGPVSGDYCDVITEDTEEGRFLFAVGDVSGKGVAASILMAHLHAIFRSLAPLSLPMDLLVQQANRLFCEGTLSTHFVTLVCGRAGVDGRVELCNAGHCYPLVVSREGAVRTIESNGMPLGMFCSGTFSSQQLVVAPGELLFVYSDGLTEAADPSGSDFGEDRLVEVVRAQHSAPPARVIEGVIEAWSTFRRGAPPRDDVTVLALRRGFDGPH